MHVGYEFINGLHADSTATIAQAGVLGDSYVDISSANAKGPEPVNNAELKAGGAPSIQDVIRTSQVSIQEITALIRKVETLVDTLNTKRGTMGELINDPDLYKKISGIATNLQTITGAMADGKGSLGKLMTTTPSTTAPTPPWTSWRRSPPISMMAKAARASSSRTTRSTTT